MKKLFGFMAAALMLVSCGGNDVKKEEKKVIKEHTVEEVISVPTQDLKLRYDYGDTSYGDGVKMIIFADVQIVGLKELSLPENATRAYMYLELLDAEGFVIETLSGVSGLPEPNSKIVAEFQVTKYRGDLEEWKNKVFDATSAVVKIGYVEKKPETKSSGNSAWN